MSELIDINPLPSGTKVDAIYVLGGSQTSLELKYKTASELYHKGICKRIWILSRSGITEYSASMGRNLTNNEWSILKLTEFGVPAECIEPIKINEGFFGTFTEAKGISSLIKKQGYKSLLLIASPEHLYRAEISFDNFLKDQNISIYACPVKSGFYLTGVKGSSGRVLLRDLLLEFIKLKVYQYFLVR
ncbi:MAG: YdcF family protein [Thermodesulfobacteriota bacterium]|nr:YdcF family protein [Thermodesulfobacteriota bacterium]